VEVVVQVAAGRVVRLDPDVHARRSRVKLSLLDLPLLPPHPPEPPPAGGGDRVEVAVQAAAGRVVRLDPDVHAQRSRVRLSLLDLPLLPEQLRELLPGEVRERLEARSG